jgi:hypothetical protein
MHNNLGFFANWLPGDRLELGEAGVIEAGRFRKVASLAELGISIVKSAAGSPQNARYESTAGTKVNFSGGAAATPGTKGEISVEFSKEGAFLFHSSGLRHQRIENRLAVTEAILKAHESGRWKKEWYLIEGLHTAELATVILSEESSAEIVLTATTDLPIGISLSDPHVDLSISSTRGKIFHLVGGKQISPLYSCLRIKDRLFGATTVEPVRGGAGDRNASLWFEKPAIEDLLDS